MARGRGVVAGIAVLVCAGFGGAPAAAAAATLDAQRAQALGSVSPRFLSFGFDISQLTERSSGSPADFTRPQLIRLARALAPAYVRYSGTKIDETFYDSTGVLGAHPPAPYKYVLGRSEWDAANRFAAGAGLGVIIGINGGPGPRKPDFAWSPGNARALLERAKAIGLPPAVVSFGNEPNLAVYGSGMPGSYSAADYRRDVQDFLALRAELVPKSTFIGPGPFFTTGAERAIAGAALGPDASAIMPLLGPRYDAVSYHQYPGFGDSAKCAGLQPRPPTDPLAAEFLDRVNGALAYMTALRNAHAPGKPLWVDEFGNTACGGVVGYSNTFAASFYYLNALGTMAQGGVQVASRWTFAGPQPYALVNDATLTPRPDYWAALLWRRLMGTTVLKPAVTGAPATLRTYASCTPGIRGGVTTLALNTDHGQSARIDLSGPARAYVVTGDLGSEQVALNGTALALTAAGELPTLTPAAVQNGTLTLPPASYAFIAQPQAQAVACGAPPPRVKVSVAAGWQRIGDVLRRAGIAASCGLDVPGSCAVRASITRWRALWLGLAVPRRADELVIAEGKTTLARPGRQRLVLGLRSGVAQALAKRLRGPLVVELRAEGSAARRRPGQARSLLVLYR